MANVYAIKTGNWSDTTVWNTGALPTSADDVFANTFTVTIDTSPTVLSIRTTSGSGITTGGTFVATNGRTLTCTGSGVIAATGWGLIASLTSGQSFSLISSVTGGSGASTVGGALLTGAGTLNITGNVSGGGSFSAGNGPGVKNDSTGVVNITGNVTATGSDHGVMNTSTGTINITGNISGSSVGAWAGVAVSAAGTVNITGNATGGSAGYAILNNSTGTVNQVGSAFASGTSAIGPGSMSQNTYLTGPFIGTAQGVQANTASRWRWVASIGSSYMTAVNSTGTGYKNFYTADNTSSTSGQPSIGNVRSGVVYGPASELTGTCAVPNANSVAYGVPVDNTTGNAVLTTTAVKEACSKAIVPALIALG